MYDVDHASGTWYIRTNLEAPNYHIVSVADADLSRGRSAWHELVPVRKDTLIEGVKAFDGFLAMEERFEANRRIVLRTADGHTREVPADEPAFAMTLARDQDSKGHWVRYDYESLATRPLRGKSMSTQASNALSSRKWSAATNGTDRSVSGLNRPRRLDHGYVALR